MRSSYCLGGWEMQVSGLDHPVPTALRQDIDDDTVAKYLPKRTYTIFGKSFSLNPGPWNAKEHALIVVAYWGSCYAAYGG